MTPLSYSQARYLSYVESHPGHSRSELAKLLYPEQNPYYSLRRVSKLHKSLEKRGLVELDTIREGGRLGVLGVYRVGQKRESKPGYLGVFGWVERNRDETKKHA